MDAVMYTRENAPDPVRPLELFGNSARFLYGEEALTGPDEAARWLVEHDFLPEGATLTPGETERLVEFRETLRDHLASPDRADHPDRADRGDQAETATALNAYAEVTLRGAGWTAGGAPTLFPVTTDGVDGLIARLLTLLHQAETTGQARRLKPCRAQDCRWMFYDRSPSGNSVWCSMDICGARHKMRDYRSRRRGG